MDNLSEGLRAVQKRNCELCLSYGYRINSRINRRRNRQPPAGSLAADQRGQSRRQGNRTQNQEGREGSQEREEAPRAERRGAQTDCRRATQALGRTESQGQVRRISNKSVFSPCTVGGPVMN